MQHASDFSGRVAVVTGGSDGLGFDFCRALCEAGCEVYFCARNETRGAAAAAMLGPRAHFIRADLARPEDIANSVVFLSSDSLARHVTGQTIVIAGGMEGRQLWRPDEIDPTIAL